MRVRIVRRRASAANAKRMNVAPRVRGLPAIDADERGRRDVPAGLLQRFADGGRHQRFAGLEMSRRLVEPQRRPRFLLDEQERAVALDDGRRR